MPIISLKQKIKVTRQDGSVVVLPSGALHVDDEIANDPYVKANLEVQDSVASTGAQGDTVPAEAMKAALERSEFLEKALAEANRRGGNRRASAVRAASASRRR